MTCKTETTQIGNYEFSVTQWPAEKALLMKFKLAKVFGSSIGSLLKTVDVSTGKTDDSEIGAAISSAIGMMFENNSPEEVASLIKECIVGTACGDQRITATSFNEIFSGDNLMDMYKVFFFVIKVNYGNLLKGQKVGDLLAKVKSQK